MVVELIKVFEKEGHVLGFDVNHPQPTTILGLTNHLPSGKRISFYLISMFLPPQATPPNLVKMFHYFWRQSDRAHGLDS